MGTGAASYRVMATSPDSALPPLVGRRRKRREDKEELVKLLRAARERREEVGWFVTGNFLCLLIMFSCLIKVGVTLLNLVLCTFPHLQMSGQCPANVKANENTISGCSSSLLLPQGIVTSVGIKTPSGTTLAPYLVNGSALPSVPKQAVAHFSTELYI